MTDRRTLWVLAAAIPLIAWGLFRIRLENDIENWLPEDDPGSLVLDWHHEHFDPQERFLVTWDSSSLDDPRTEQLALELALPDAEDGERKGRHPEIDHVSTPRDLLARMVDNGVPADAAIEHATGVVVGRGFLKVRLTAAGRRDPAETRRVLLGVLDALGLDGEVVPAIPAVEATFPAPGDGAISTGGLPSPLVKWEPHDLQLKWRGMTPASPETTTVAELLLDPESASHTLVEKVFLQAGAPVAMTIVLTPLGSDSVTRTSQIVREAAQRAGIPPEELHFGGGPIVRSRLSREALRAVWNEDYPIWNLFKRSPVLLSVLVGMAISLLLLKSLRLTLIVLLASLEVSGATIALVPLFGDAMNMVLIIMPTLLFVVTMSGAVHLVNYWRHETAKGVGDPVETALKSARLPCALSSFTTAIGTGSLMTSTLAPIRQFGLYSTIGILLSLAMVLYGVPALLRLAGGRPAVERDSKGWIWRGIGRSIARYHWATNFLMLMIFLHALWGLSLFQTETKVIRYFPDHLRIIRDYDFFEQSLAGVVNVDVLLRFGQDTISRTTVGQRLELVRETELSLANEAGVTGTLSLADFRPPAPPPDPEAPLAARLIYKRGMNRLYAGIFGRPPRVAAEEVPDEPPSAEGDPPPRASASHLVAIAQRPLKGDRNGHPVSISVEDEVWRVRVQCTILQDIRYEDLLTNVETRVQRVVDEMPGVDFVVTGTVPLFLRAQQALLDSLLQSFGLAMLLITIVMIVLLRSVLGGLYAMLPNVWPVGVSFGWISWAGIPVDVGTMMTASIALGIAIDGTLHFITWFEDCLTHERHRAEAVRTAMERAGPALFQTSTIIALGMVMLSGADLLLIARFGWLMALLVVTALIGDLVLLPALLAGQFGLLVRGPISRQATDRAVQRQRDHRRSSPGAEPPG